MGFFADLEAGGRGHRDCLKTGNEIKYTGKLRVVMEPEEAGVEPRKKERGYLLGHVTRI